MDFIKGRVDIEPGQLPLAAELFFDLNQACWAVFSRSLRDKMPPKAMSAPWAMKAGCFIDRSGGEALFTSHQKSMAVRKAQSLRKTANVRAKWLSEHHAKLAAEC